MVEALIGAATQKRSHCKSREEVDARSWTPGAMNQCACLQSNLVVIELIDDKIAYLIREDGPDGRVLSEDPKE